MSNETNENPDGDLKKAKIDGREKMATINKSEQNDLENDRDGRLTSSTEMNNAHHENTAVKGNSGATSNEKNAESCTVVDLLCSDEEGEKDKINNGTGASFQQKMNSSQGIGQKRFPNPAHADAKTQESIDGGNIHDATVTGDDSDVEIINVTNSPGPSFSAQPSSGTLQHHHRPGSSQPQFPLSNPGPWFRDTQNQEVNWARNGIFPPHASQMMFPNHNNIIQSPYLSTLNSIENMYRPIVPTRPPSSLEPDPIHPMHHHSHQSRVHPVQRQAQQPRMNNHTIIQNMDSKEQKAFSIPPNVKYLHPYYFPKLQGHTPTWTNFFPSDPIPSAKIEVIPPPPLTSSTEIRVYKLTLFSQKEFILTAESNHTNLHNAQTSLRRLRTHIKRIARNYGSGGKAVFENGLNGQEGRWRIPLSAYHAFHSFLCSDPQNIVHGIPENQLKIVSIGLATSQRNFPSPEDLMEHGVPRGIAQALAPYQRKGVDFVLQRGGRALIADEMGLGKTIQSIASMTCYETEWPLLILSPSSARYHWEAEFKHWLGKRSSVNAEDRNKRIFKKYDEKSKENSSDVLMGNKRSSSDFNDSNNSRRKRERLSEDKPKRSCMKLLGKYDIQVLSSSRELFLPIKSRIVVCSYGLAPNLIEYKKIRPGTFKCIIVDESHMLKNKNSKRTMTILPILMAASRVVMLSGTPAFAKPVELYPQLAALGDKSRWWGSESDFISKYANTRHYTGEDESEAKNNNLAELHTMLTSTVMIRRMKADILKTLPNKIRENLLVKIRRSNHVEEIRHFMHLLREGKGILGKLSREHYNRTGSGEVPTTSAYVTNHNSQEQPSRKMVLNHVFSLTGMAKVPVVVDLLLQWLNDPTKGKLCIFAHHISVLDAIVRGAKLSNDKFSKKKYIRIDGSTLPRSRQDQIVQFQTDPTVRIAILGITAAGVAVTLTAASTIWFAELFWTPAIMIQAEDRCHRIGQQATVRCLYIIGRGTLDEILWKLIEKKFRDLGEFVEGKEELNIVVHKIYQNEQSMLEANDDSSEKDIDNECNGDNDLSKKSCAVEEENKNDGNMQLPDEIQHDIEELAMEEQAKLKENNDEDDEKETSTKTSTIGLKTPQEKKPNPTKIGSSETSAICLSDDENDAEDTSGQAQPILLFSDLLKEYQELGRINVKMGPTVQLPKLSLYKIYFSGPYYNLEMAQYAGRVIVKSNRSQTSKHSSTEMKPIAGNILVAVNGKVIRHNTKLSEVHLYMKKCIAEASVELTFGEDEDFQIFFREAILPALKLRDTKKAKNDTSSQPEVLKSTTPLNTNLNANQNTMAASALPAQSSSSDKSLCTEEINAKEKNDENVVDLLDD